MKNFVPSKLVSTIRICSKPHKLNITHINNVSFALKNNFVIKYIIYF